MTAAREGEILLEMQDVHVGAGDRTVLAAVDLAVRRGEILTVVGPNGSGKSTLLRTMIGAIRPRRGRVSTRSGLRIGYVPQRLHVDDTLPLTVSRFLSLQGRGGRVHPDEALSRVGLGSIGRQAMTTLSGGQMQRALLARALLAAPQLLLLDEPTQGLDQPGTAAFYRLIEELREALACAVVLVSHDLHVVMRASDRVLCLNGHVCCQGSPEVVASMPAYRALFGEHTRGAFALYRHEHDHAHDPVHTSDTDSAAPPLVAHDDEPDAPRAHAADQSH